MIDASYELRASAINSLAEVRSLLRQFRKECCAFADSYSLKRKKAEQAVQLSRRIYELARKANEDLKLANADECDTVVLEAENLVAAVQTSLRHKTSALGIAQNRLDNAAREKQSALIGANTVAVIDEEISPLLAARRHVLREILEAEPQDGYQNFPQHRPIED